MLARLTLEYRTPYPTSDDRQQIENYLATVRARRNAFEEIRRVVVAVIDRLIERMRQAYPEFARYHGHGFEKGHRDLVLLTQMAANAMFLGEYQTLDEMFTEWYRTIIKASHLSPTFVRDTLAVWREELQAALSDEAYALLRPVADHLAEYLTRIPVPPKDETGKRLPVPPRR
jgi:cyclopropane fatty-acyl-phospholipid synthase-like methyltransferase